MNPAESVRLLRVSAGVGDPASQNALGEALTRGIGVEKDEKAAFARFDEAAMSGHHGVTLGCCVRLVVAKLPCDARCECGLS